MLEEREIRHCITDVGEVVAEGLPESGQLIVAGKVEGSVGGQDAGEEVEVVGDPMSEGGVGCCGEVDGTTGGVLLFEVLQELSVVGQMGDIELHGARDVALQRSFTLTEPAGKLEEQGRIVTCKGELGIDERIRFDQSAVEIDAKRWKCCGAGNREGQGIPSVDEALA
jgi:hypothetical protein